MTTPTELRALLAEALPYLHFAAPAGFYDRITAALSEKDEGGLKMHDPEGQRRCGFPPDDVIVDSETVYNVSDAQPLPPLPERK